MINHDHYAVNLQQARIASKECAMNIESVVKQYEKHKSYMSAYNKRPNVKAKRKSYNRERWQLIKATLTQLKKEGLV